MMGSKKMNKVLEEMKYEWIDLIKGSRELKVWKVLSLSIISFLVGYFTRFLK